MKIELKNIKHFASGSQETNCFTADLWVDNVKVGYCENDGHGGQTNVQPFPGNRDQFKAVEQYAKSLPKVTVPSIITGEEFSFDSDLEHIVDTLLEAHLKEKEQKRINKAIEKKCENAIVFGSKSEQGYSYRMMKFNQPISAIINMGEKGKTFIADKIAKVKAMMEPGEIIFNNNLPK